MIYFDNSAATYPKPNQCLSNVKSIFEKYSFNIGRGGYKEALKTAEKVFEVRELASELFGVKENCVVFTKNCTESLNFAIKSICRKGDNFIISSLEHNSVLRVFKKLSNDGVADFSIADFSFDETELLNNFTSLIKNNTKAIVCTFSNNVFGCVLPIEKIGKICKERGIVFIIDASQGAGLFDIDLKRDKIDILCTSGQKSLYGPMGSGLLIFNDESLLNNKFKLNSVTEGGTGSKSLNIIQPDFLPDKFETGTLNTTGIILLGEGIKFINNKGIENIYLEEMELISTLYEMLSEIKSVKLYTPYPQKYKFSPIVSFNIKDFSSEKTASILAGNNICTRGGYHCSPLSHKTFNTLESGTVRVSLGCFNTLRECEKLVNVLKKL